MIEAMNINKAQKGFNWFSLVICLECLFWLYSSQSSKKLVHQSSNRETWDRFGWRLEVGEANQRRRILANLRWPSPVCPSAESSSRTVAGRVDWSCKKRKRKKSFNPSFRLTPAPNRLRTGNSTAQRTKRRAEARRKSLRETLATLFQFETERRSVRSHSVSLIFFSRQDVFSKKNCFANFMIFEFLQRFRWKWVSRSTRTTWGSKSISKVKCCERFVVSFSR
jgi:hypothetical protein